MLDGMKIPPTLAAVVVLAAGCAGPVVVDGAASDAGKASATNSRQQGALAAQGPGNAWNCEARVELSSLWAEVSRRHDHDGDGRVTAEEYDRGEVRFRNYDRSGDGVLDATDFPEDTFFNGFSAMLVQQGDGDRDGQVTRAEWAAFSARFDEDGDGEPGKAGVQAVVGEWAADWPLFLLSFDQDADGDFDALDLELTFVDQDFDGDGVLIGKEMQGWQPTTSRRRGEAPAPGASAPDFTLSFSDGEGEFHLQDPERTRPVALIFGSYT
jgi:hypothetical protein